MIVKCGPTEMAATDEPHTATREALTSVRGNTLSKPGRYGDGNGLYLVVDPSGAKRWVLRTVVDW